MTLLSLSMTSGGAALLSVEQQSSYIEAARLNVLVLAAAALSVRAGCRWVPAVERDVGTCEFIRCWGWVGSSIDAVRIGCVHALQPLAGLVDCMMLPSQMSHGCMTAMGQVLGGHIRKVMIQRLRDVADGDWPLLLSAFPLLSVLIISMPASSRFMGHSSVREPFVTACQAAQRSIRVFCYHGKRPIEC